MDAIRLTTKLPVNSRFPKHNNALFVWELTPPVSIQCEKVYGMRQWALTILCWKTELFFLIVKLLSRPSNAAKAFKRRKGKELGTFLYFLLKKRILSGFFLNHYQNLLQTHRAYSIPIKLYRASPALDCQRGPSVLIYRPRKHSTIMVINNNRIQYMTTWMMEPLRIHLHCFVLQSSCL